MQKLTGSKYLIIWGLDNFNIDGFYEPLEPFPNDRPVRIMRLSFFIFRYLTPQLTLLHEVNSVKAKISQKKMWNDNLNYLVKYFVQYEVNSVKTCVKEISQKKISEMTTLIS